jgi:hypothetical protein
MLKTPLNEAKTAVIEPFLAIDTETLPKKLRVKARAKQVEVKTLLKLHDTKKKGNVLQSLPGCSAGQFVKHPRELPFFQQVGYAEVNEDDVEAVKTRTLCTDDDLTCQFSMLIFYDPDAKPKKPRRLFLLPNDPLMIMIEAAKKKVQGGNYFGTGFSCMK